MLKLWASLNAKPAGWDEPKNWIGRMLTAVAIGLFIWWFRPHG